MRGLSFAIRPGAPAGLALAAMLLASPAAGEAPFWTENSGLSVCLTACIASGSSSSAGDSLAGLAPPMRIGGEVFDSPDFQQMLLLSGNWETAYLLELATGQVVAHPQSAFLGDGGTLLPPPAAGGRSVALFLVQGDGSITFAAPDCDVVVEPAAALVGSLSRAELDARLPGYLRRAGAYLPEPSAIAALADLDEEIEIVAFFGSWCSLCKEHLPALLRTVDEAANPKIRLSLIGMDEDLAEPLELIAEFDIGDVPTFVVLHRGTEIGRIAEQPEISIEADLAQILMDELPR